MRSRIRDRGLLAFCVLVLGGTILYPTGRLVVRALAGWNWEAVVSGAGFVATRNTVFISLASVVTSGVVGTALAFALTRYSFPGRRTLAGLAYLPFALPPLVGTVAFYYLIGRDGFVALFVERVFGLEGFFPRGAVAILLVHTYSFYVFFYAMVSAALEMMDASQIEAARTLGASPARVLTKIVLPALKPALLASSLLTFMSSGASFSAPLFFGYDFPVLTVRIYEENAKFNEAEALSLTGTLALVSLCGVALFRLRRLLPGVASKGAPRPLRSLSGRFVAGLLAFLCITLLLVPHLTILWLSFVDHQQWLAEVIPTSFTVRNYVEIFRDPGNLAPIRNSLWMSGAAAVAVLVVGLPAAYLIGRRRPGGRGINFLVMIPWALPGTVIAMNLIAAFNDPWLPAWTVLWLLPMAYFVRTIPLFTRMATAAIETFEPSLVEAGRSLGATPLRCFVRIVAPLLAPALVAGVALVFATCLGEFVASILLYQPGTIPIAVQINMLARGSGIGSAFAYSVFLMILLTATFLFARRFSTRLL